MKQRIYNLPKSGSLPIIRARAFGPKGDLLVNLVFDTGAPTTQLNTSVIEDLGYSIRQAIDEVISVGPAGPLQTGYRISLDRLRVLGSNHDNSKIAVYDFDNFTDYRIDGLLGFDIIRTLHIELNGKKNRFTVFQ